MFDVFELVLVFRLDRAAFAGAVLAFAVLLLCGCAPTTLGIGGGDEPPDALDRVRGVDLEPRFPKPPEPASGGGATANRALVYYGSPGGGAQAARPGALPGTGEGVDLNFENTPVTAVAKVILGDILGVGYTIDPRVQGTISLSSGRPVPKANLLFVLESALRASNAVLAHDAGGYRILPADDAIGSGGVDRAGGGRSPEPGYGVTVIPLQHVSAPTMMKLLEGFAAKAGAIRADPGKNLLVVIGNGIERRTAVETVLSFDADWMRGQSVGIFPVVNTTPEPLIAELEKILDSGEGGLSQTLVKLQPVGHMNAILVVAQKPELLRTAATWIGRLDRSTAMSTGVKVYRVRYGDARQIAKLLSDLFVGGGGGGLDQDQLAPGAGASTLSASERLTGGPPAQGQSSPFGSLSSGSGQGGSGSGSGSSFGSGSGSGSGFGSGSGSFGSGSGGGSGAGGTFGGRTSLAGASAGFGSGGGGVGGGGGAAVLLGVRIMADVANNAVVIYANQEHYRIIEKALQQLDRPRMQVAVDLTIAEVTLTDQLGYGVQFFLGSLNTLHSFSNGVQAINSATNGLPSTNLPGFSLMLGSKLTPHVIINALHDYTSVKILSSPSLVVVDNQVATLTVGDQVPISTGSATVLTTSNTVVNTIDYKNTGIILRVQPRINYNGNVLLDIEQEISQCQNCRTLAPNLTPTISERKVKSSILVAGGQTVLLAGLIQEDQNGERDGIPILDQIPILGDAFVNNNSKQIKRTELIIFIRPQIIRDGVDASFVAEELRAKMRGDKIGAYRPPGAVVPNPPPPLIK